VITTTARNLVQSTLKLIGVLAAEEDPTASELEDGIAVLNALIDEWGVHRLTMLANARYTFDLAVDQQSYTIGETGDFTLEPPLELDHVALLLPVGTSDPRTETPLGILTLDLYAATQIKELTSSLPTVCYYNRPSPEVATLWLWPVPQQSGLGIVLYVPTAVTQFSNATVEVSLDAGYFKALRYNLAIELAAEYTIPPRGDIADLAAKTLSNIKRINLVMSDLTIDPALQPTSGSSYNILTDTGA